MSELDDQTTDDGDNAGGGGGGSNLLSRQMSMDVAKVAKSASATDARIVVLEANVAEIRDDVKQLVALLRTRTSE